jgi:hypothetical protein
MKHLLLVFLTIFLQASISAQVHAYFSSFRKSDVSNFGIEQNIISQSANNGLLDSLTNYYSDTLISIRQKAYYLTFKIGIKTDLANQSNTVHRLLEGCNDANGGIVGQCVQHLQKYPQNAFDEQSKNQINKLLQKKQQPHYKRLILLAGYAGAGNEVMRRKLLLPDKEPQDLLWAIHLAQARMGNQESLNFCVEKAQRLPIGNEMATWLIPEMIYTRQKKAIDFCVSVLNCDDALCNSSNPDQMEKILCGYRVLELLTPVIKDFPLHTDASGGLSISDYPKALAIARDWFAQHKDYQIVTNTY